MRLIIALLLVYACFAWLAIRWLRLASLPDRRFFSKEIPSVATLPEEMIPQTPQEMRAEPALLPSPRPVEDDHPVSHTEAASSLMAVRRQQVREAHASEQ